jgi:hypothetical protein
MSLQSAAMELGGAIGAAAFGVALALSDDYAATYRLLGVVALIMLLCLAMSARRARVTSAGRETGAEADAARTPAAVGG